MSVHRVPRAAGVVWKVRWREGDRNRSRSFDLKRDADAFERELRRLRQAGELDLHRRAATITLSEYADDWWARHAEPQLTAATRDNYALQLDKRVIPALGHKALRQITPREIDHWTTRMRAAGDGDPTILKALGVLQAIMARAVVDELVARNPVPLVRKPRQSRTREPVFLHPEHVEQIRRELLKRRGGLRDATLVSVLAYAGPRPESEALPLRWAAIRDNGLVLHATKKGGQAGPQRVVDLLEPLAADLAEWRLACGRPAAMDLVFPDAQGRVWPGHTWDNWRDRIFRPAATTAGLPADLRPRDLRGSFASLLIWEGRSIVEVADQLGHSVQQCSKAYLGVLADYTPDRRRDATAAIRAARQPPADEHRSADS